MPRYRRIPQGEHVQYRRLHLASDEMSHVLLRRRHRSAVRSARVLARARVVLVFALFARARVVTRVCVRVVRVRVRGWSGPLVLPCDRHRDSRGMK